MCNWWKNRLTEWRSTVRWGMLSIITTLATSFLALSIAFYSVHLTLNKGRIMPSGSLEFVAMLVFVIIGGILAVLGLALAIGWFIKPNVEDTTILGEIKARVDRIEKYLGTVLQSGQINDGEETETSESHHNDYYTETYNNQDKTEDKKEGYQQRGLI